MLRRLIALLAMAFVLFGTISPALACVAQMGHGDCCPSGSSAPCGEKHPGSDPGTSIACCAPSSQTASASVSVSREQVGQFSHPTGSPDPVIAVIWLATFTPSSYSNPRPPHTLDSASDAGELTYLRTMRLRL